MVGVSLFGTVTSVCKVSTSGSTFYLEIEDATGVVLTKLIFTGHWYHYLLLFLPIIVSNVDSIGSAMHLKPLYCMNTSAGH